MHNEKPTIALPREGIELPEALTSRFICTTHSSGQTPCSGHIVEDLDQKAPRPCLDLVCLNDAWAVERFIVQTYTQAQCTKMLEQGFSCHTLTCFHARYKYLLMALDPKRYKSLGQYLGDMPSVHFSATEYFAELMIAIQQKETVQGNCNAIQHIAGYLKKRITRLEQQDLQSRFEDYRQGRCDLNQPRNKLIELFAQHPHAYISQQTFLFPDIAWELLPQ